MKRIFILFLCVLLPALSYAQADVQGEFWGVSFYGSKAWVSREFSKHATPEYSSNPNQLKFSNGYFGGQLWDSIYAEFYKDSFCGVYFISTYSDLKTASAIYASLQEKLQQKYGGLYSNTYSEDGRYNYVVFGEKRGCMLSFDIDTDDFDTWYSILLFYDCLALSQMLQDSEADEL